MSSQYLFKSKVIGLACALTCALASASASLHAANAGESGFSLLKDAEDFRIQSAKFLNEDDKVCLAGRFLKDDEARNYGRIMLLDVAQRKVSWEKQIMPPDDAQEISLVDCVRYGNAIYAVANVKLVSKQMMVWLYRFDQHGKQLAAKALEVEGDNVLVGAIDVVDGNLFVSGMAQSVGSTEEGYAVFLGKLDAGLTAETRLIKKGGFRSGATMKWVGKSLFLGGYFLPQKLNKNDLVNDYANAKMSLSGNYLWSARPQAADVQRVATAIDSAGNVFSLAAQNGSSMLGMVDANGKLGLKTTIASKFCDTTSIAALEVNLLAVRKPCDSAKKRASLVLIDKKNGKETEPGLSKDEPLLVFAAPGRWALISKDEKGILNVQFGKIGAP